MQEEEKKLETKVTVEIKYKRVIVNKQNNSTMKFHEEILLDTSNLTSIEGDGKIYFKEEEVRDAIQ